MLIKRIVGYWVLKLIGWSFDRNFDWQDKQVVIGFPHTSNMDGVRSMFMYPLLGIDAHFLVKEELFRWPFSGVLRFMGGIPVTRSHQGNQVEELARQIRQSKKFTLVLAPEGTRGKMSIKAPVIKTGFWHIARSAGVPIVLMISEEKTRHGRFIGSILPGNNLQQDLLAIQKIYHLEGINISLPELSED